MPGLANWSALPKSLDVSIDSRGTDTHRHCGSADVPPPAVGFPVGTPEGAPVEPGTATGSSVMHSPRALVCEQSAGAAPAGTPSTIPTSAAVVKAHTPATATTRRFTSSP